MRNFFDRLDSVTVPQVSLGDAALLQAVTPEVSNQLERWNLLGADRVVVHVELATKENFPELFRKFFLLHSARWAESSQPGVLADPKLEQFHLEAASAFLERISCVCTRPV